MTSTDVFFWGNKVGDIGSPTSTSFTVTAAGDATPIIAGGLGPAGGITNVRDIDRSNTITAAGDRTAATSNIGSITRISLGTGGPFGPEPGAAPSGDSGVASALASSGSSSGARSLPASVSNRLGGAVTSAAPVAASILAVLADDGGDDDGGDDDDDGLGDLLDALAAG
jgi:hypothetical protein